MDDPLKKFLAEADAIRLTPDEKGLILKNIRAHAEAHPAGSLSEAEGLIAMEDMLASVGNTEEHSLKKREKTQLRGDLALFMKNHPSEETYERKLTIADMFVTFIGGIIPRTLVLACLFLLVGAGAAAAAESSIPGDWLYPFKVEVVERVRGGLAFTPAQKARWEATRTLRRIEEAGAMAAKDDVTSEAWSGLNAEFMNHVEEAKKKIDEVAKYDAKRAEKLSGDLDIYVQTHESISAAVAEERRNNSDIDNVIEDVQETQTHLRAREPDPEALTPTEAARMADHTEENAALALKKALDLIVPLRTDKGLTDRPEAKKKLIEAEAMLQEADAQFGAGLFDESLALAREAQSLAQETELLLRLPLETSESSSASSQSAEKEASADDVKKVKEIGVEKNKNEEEGLPIDLENILEPLGL